MSGVTLPVDRPHPRPVEERLQEAGELGKQLFRFVRLIGRKHAHLPDVYREGREGLEKVGYVLLAHLVHVGPERATALAEAVHSDLSTISRQVAALVRAGWIERRPDPEDGRAYLLAATDEGVEVFRRISERRNEHLARILDGWPEGDGETLTRLLHRFNDDFEDYLPRASDACGQANQRKEKLG